MIVDDQIYFLSFLVKKFHFTN